MSSSETDNTIIKQLADYFIDALKTKGLIRGIKLGSKRILKCHPIKSLGGSEGLDLVPGINEKESKNG